MKTRILGRFFKGTEARKLQNNKLDDSIMALEFSTSVILTFMAATVVAWRVCFGSVLVYNEKQCEDYCLRSEGCTRYTIINRSETTLKYTCLTYNDQHAELKIRSELRVSCESKPCEHGGTCVPDSSRCRRFYCVCQKNWEGETCHTKTEIVKNNSS